MKIKNKILFFIEIYTIIYQLRGVRKYWQLKLHNIVFYYKNTTILFAICSLLSNLFSSTYSNGVRRSEIKSDTEYKRFCEHTYFDTVRGLFTEGGPAFEGAGIQSKNH